MVDLRIDISDRSDQTSQGFTLGGDEANFGKQSLKYVCAKRTPMPHSNDVEKMICRMLDMGDEELLAEMERTFQLSDERHQRISDTLEEMMQEVDRLISRMD